MCGRYVVFTDKENEELRDIVNGINERLKTEALKMKTGEIFPTDLVPVLTASSFNTLPNTPAASVNTVTGSSVEYPFGAQTPSITAPSAQLFNWGFPNFAKANAVIINARCETLQEKPTFRKYLDSGRCIVPASGFYEWKAASDPKQKKDKYLIRSEGSRIMYFAGLYGSFLDKTGIRTNRFVIITTDANEQMSEIHSRMPVVLDKSEAMAWLDNANKNIESLLRPYGSRLSMEKVS